MIAISLFCGALLVCLVLGANILYALATGLVIFTAYGRRRGFSWKELGKMICSGVKTSTSVLLVFPLIGMLTALSGVHAARCRSLSAVRWTSSGQRYCC